MKALQQEWQELTGIPQRSRFNNSGFQFVWDCIYSPAEESLSDVDHGCFRNIAVAPAIYDAGRYACLDMQTDIYCAHPEILCNASIRVVLRDKHGTTLFRWKSAVVNKIFLLDAETFHTLRMSIPMPYVIPQRMANGDAHQLECLFEDEQGRVLDGVSGEMVIRAI